MVEEEGRSDFAQIGDAITMHGMACHGCIPTVANESTQWQMEMAQGGDSGR